MSLRSRPCGKCQKRFYADVKSKATTCQVCSGAHDPSKQKKADAKLIAASQKSRNTTVPQSVNPNSPKGKAELKATQAPGPISRSPRVPQTAPAVPDPQTAPATPAAPAVTKPAGVPGA